MRKLNIEITKAQILSYTVSLVEEDIGGSVTIGLFTDYNKQISSYTLNTNSWNKENQFTLPVGMYKPIKDIMSQLEEIVTRHCREGQQSLPEHI